MLPMLHIYYLCWSCWASLYKGLVACVAFVAYASISSRALRVPLKLSIRNCHQFGTGWYDSCYPSGTNKMASIRNWMFVMSWNHRKCEAVGAKLGFVSFWRMLKIYAKRAPNIHPIWFDMSSSLTRSTGIRRRRICLHVSFLTRMARTYFPFWRRGSCNW